LKEKKGGGERRRRRRHVSNLNIKFILRNDGTDISNSLLSTYFGVSLPETLLCYMGMIYSSIQL
jgi:hypothetical protein